MSRAATRTGARRIWQSWLRQRPALIAVMALVAAAGAATVGAEAAGPRLNGIVARANARSTSVLIEASEPVAYSASRPDPRTVVVELLNVTTAGAVNRVGPSGQGVVEGVTVEQDDGAEGGTFARVTVKLTQPVPYAVRSARNVIEVELDPVQTPPTAVPQAAQSASALEPAAAQDKPGTAPPAATASADPMAALRQKVGAGQPPAAAQAPQAKPVQAPAAQATPAAPPSLPQGKQYTGHPISRGST
jgi:hypothetical protein